MKLAKYAIALLASALILTGCGLPTGNERPQDSKMRDGIKLLITQFESKYPKLVNWESKKVRAQISKRLPDGMATESGWTLKWPDYAEGELSSVVIPWVILAQYPTKFAPDINNYNEGMPVPAGVAAQITKLKQDEFGSNFFASVVNQRISTVDRKWIVFTTVPYLPVTDPAYGFAKSVNGKWEIVDFGTATVGCSVVPTAVQSEFGFTCPPK
jgi:hypothetical protein